MRRRVPWWVLALLFVVLPVVEIYLLIQVGQVIGAWWTSAADRRRDPRQLADEARGHRAWAALREALEQRRCRPASWPTRR